ncbi:putative tRNA binding domain protein, partial [Vibrio parahaemolyticus V-223/04]
VKSAYLTALT